MWYVAARTVDEALGVLSSEGGGIINPVIVEGQITGGVAQGLDGAVRALNLRRKRSNADRLRLWIIWCLPARRYPDVEFGHIETLTPVTVGGMKGMGEGGAIGSPAAIISAISDALQPLGGSVTKLPLSFEEIYRMATADRSR